jgi:hypothetical protein
MLGIPPLSLALGAVAAICAFLLAGGETVGAVIVVGIIGALAVVLWHVAGRFWDWVYRDR